MSRKSASTRLANTLPEAGVLEVDAERSSMVLIPLLFPPPPPRFPSLSFRGDVGVGVTGAGMTLTAQVCRRPWAVMRI